MKESLLLYIITTPVYTSYIFNRGSTNFKFLSEAMSALRTLISILQKTLLSQGFVLTHSMTLMNRVPKVDITDRVDYPRLMALDLCADEILSKRIEGSIAEVGVFRGDFARKLNSVFSDRKLYLFDTFEGFDQRDTRVDQQNNFSTGTQDFSKTSVDYVLGRMPHSDRCIIKQGYFPETAHDLQTEKYAFVSIDVDLYKPIADGLEYFYSRLSPGGYIFVHDYNNAEYKGVKKAVREFSEKNGIPYFPLPDSAGSAIFTK
jgi:O-methyltransferase